MAKVFAGAAVAADVAAPEALAFGAADLGAADVAAAGAADFGATAADIGTAGAATAGDVAAATVPDFTAGADLGAAGADLGAADVAAVGGSDLGAAGIADVGAADVGAADLGSSFAGTNFGDAFGASTDLTGGGPAGLSDIGTSGGGSVQVAGAQGGWSGYAPGVGENVPGTQGFGSAAADQASTPMVSDTGIVDTGPTLQNTMGTPSSITPASPGQAQGLINQSIGSTPSVPTVEGQFSAYSPPVSNPLEADFANFPNANLANPPSALGPQFANPSDLAMGGEPAGVTTAPTGQLATMQQVGVPATASDPFGTGPVTVDTSTVPSETAVANAYPSAPAQPLPAPTTVATAPGSVPAAPPTTSPTAATPAATPSSPAAVANAPAATAGGGTDALTALRMGAAGASIVSSGLNIANALNQPSYSALQPIYYPGSTAAASTTPFNPTPNAQGFSVDNTTGGGIAGGLAANRLTNGLLAGQSAQQLALEGLISPQRATQLQGTYQGILAEYAQQKGVDPRSLSPAVKQVVAARALADAGLGGR